MEDWGFGIEDWDLRIKKRGLGNGDWDWGLEARVKQERLPSDGVDRDSGGESGHGARAVRDRVSKCLSRLELKLIQNL